MLVGIEEYNVDSLECYYIILNGVIVACTLYCMLLYGKACMGMHEASHSNFVSRMCGFQSHNIIIYIIVCCLSHFTDILYAGTFIKPFQTIGTLCSLCHYLWVTDTLYSLHYHDLTN